MPHKILYKTDLYVAYKCSLALIDFIVKKKKHEILSRPAILFVMVSFAATIAPPAHHQFKTNSAGFISYFFKTYPIK